MAQPAMRPMGVGEVLDRSFQVLRRHFGTLVLTSLIGFAPLLLLYMMAGIPYGAAVPEDAFAAGLGATVFLLFIAMIIGAAVVWTALTHQVDQAARGGLVTVGGGLKTGFASLLRLLGAGIVAYLMLLVIMVPVGIVAAIALPAAAVGGFGAGAAAAVAITALAVVGLVVWSAMAFLLLPALVVERLGPIASVRRANALAKGGRMRVFATALLAWLVVILPSIGLPFLLGAGAAMWDPQAAGEMSTVQLYVYQALTFAISAFTTPFLAATMVYTYYDRRVRREGYDVEVASASMVAPA